MAPEEVTLRLIGDLPCKKNRIRAGPGGGHYPKAVKATLVNLELQARVQWGARPPWLHPDFEIRMFVFNTKKDRDGIFTTVLDVLKKARVIEDDSIDLCNGLRTEHPATPVRTIREERIEITVRPWKLASLRRNPWKQMDRPARSCLEEMK
jgi:Holliday junction resolvase RusA-like endonuclease